MKHKILMQMHEVKGSPVRLSDMDLFNASPPDLEIIATGIVMFNLVSFSEHPISVRSVTKAEWEKCHFKQNPVCQMPAYIHISMHVDFIICT